MEIQIFYGCNYTDAEQIASNQVPGEKEDHKIALAGGFGFSLMILVFGLFLRRKPFNFAKWLLISLVLGVLVSCGDAEVKPKTPLECPKAVITVEEPTYPNHVLISNYPNPFNARTIISYTLPEAAMVELNIYNFNGRKVKTLVPKQKFALHFLIRTFIGNYSILQNYRPVPELVNGAVSWLNLWEYLLMDL